MKINMDRCFGLSGVLAMASAAAYLKYGLTKAGGVYESCVQSCALQHQSSVRSTIAVTLGALALSAAILYIAKKAFKSGNG